MIKAATLITPLAVLLLFAGCVEQSDTASEIPVTTSSDGARNLFNAGLEAMDMGRGNDANSLFEQAIAADSTFAQGYLRIANSAASTEEFTTNLAKAVELSSNASEAEQVLISITQKGFENDVEGQLAQAQRLVELLPGSARALTVLAGIQGGMNDAEASRTTLMRAIEIAPNFAAAHMQLGNDFLFLDPKDFAQAETHFQHAADLAPEEPTPHDLLGDVHRAQGNLEAAYEDYTRAAEYAPEMGSPLQQRGHVNSFLGHFDEARADYDRSMELEMARGNNNAPFFAVFRSYVNIHEGNPAAAIAELNELAASAEELGVEGTDDVKINCLTNIAQIATHTGDYATASNAIAEMAPLMRAQAEASGTEQFQRGTEAAIVMLNGLLAARRGDAEIARARADEYTTLIEPDTNPRKMEPVHELLGMMEYHQGNHAAAAEHLAQGNPGNVYTKYYRAVSLDEAGQSDEAAALFDEIAVWNFNGLNYALIRADVLERVAP